MHWYVVESGQPTGPHDRVAIERMVALGRINAATKVCVVGDTAWSNASSDPVIGGLLVGMANAGMTARADAVLGASHPPLASSPIPEEELPAFTYGGAASLGMKAFKSRWGVLVLVALVYFAIAYALSIPGAVAEMLRKAAEESGGEAPAALGLDVIGWLLNVLVGSPMLAGWAIAGARTVRGAGGVGDLFLGFQRYGAVVLAYLVSLLLMVVAFIVAVLPGGIMLAVAVGVEDLSAGRFGAVGGVGMLLAVAGALAVSIWLLPRLMFMNALAADPSLPREGVRDTLRRSWSMTAGKAPAMFAILLVYGIVMGFTVILLCVGLPLIGAPLFTGVYGAMYATVFSAGHPTRIGS